MFAAITGAIAFLSSPIGRWLGIGVIAVAVFFAGDLRGRRIANEKCEAAARAARGAADKQDDKARTEVRQNDDQTIADLRGQKEKADATIAQLQLQLNAMPLDAPCLYGADGKPATRRVRQPAESPAPRAGNPPASRPSVLSPTRRSPAGDRGN